MERLLCPIQHRTHGPCHYRQRQCRAARSRLAGIDVQSNVLETVHVFKRSKETQMKYVKALLAAGVASMINGLAIAAPTAAEAARLGKDLTPMGSERAGNKEGTIPEWTGGLCKPPAGYKPRN